MKKQKRLWITFTKSLSLKTTCFVLKCRSGFTILPAGSDIAEAHMPFEEAKIPSTISEIDHLAYPLFLTARQFFILLDNSLADGKNFFPRDEEGELKVKIVSSDYDHENPDTLLDLEFESDIEESDESDVEESTPSQPVKTKQKLTEWKEVTASYFAENIWPSIQHICPRQENRPPVGLDGDQIIY